MVKFVTIDHASYIPEEDALFIALVDSTLAQFADVEITFTGDGTCESYTFNVRVLKHSEWIPYSEVAIAAKLLEALDATSTEDDEIPIVGAAIRGAGSLSLRFFEPSDEIIDDAA